MKWFFCLNEGDWQFEMAQVAVHTARQNTKLEPVCIYDGRDKTVIDWMAAQNVPIIFHRSALYEYACKVYEVQMGTLRASKVTGVWLRIDIPLLTDEDYILYTDTDIMFLGDCSGLEDVRPEFIAAANDANPLNNYNMNSGVLVMNVKKMRVEYDKFITFIKHNMLKSWMTYDQNAYDQYYGHRTLRLPIEFNWKSFWEDDFAIWNPDIRVEHDPDIRVERTRPIQILHFTGTKPWDKTKYKEGMGLYRSKNNHHWQRKWRTYFDKVKLSDKPDIEPTVTYPYNIFLNTPLLDNSFTLEELITDFGVNLIDSPESYPDYIKAIKPKPDLRIWQQPNQLAPFMEWISKMKIDNYTEIGAAHGGTFYTIDSFLRVINSHYTGGTAVDIKNTMRNFVIYYSKFPDTKFVQSRSVDYIPSEPIDLCFIDTHSGSAKSEYEHFKNHCKYLAFHDIYEFSELKTLWTELKVKHPVNWEFTQQYGSTGKDSMGIGVIKI